MRAHATFGLINSTPHSVRSHGRRIAIKRARPLLESMALAALMATAGHRTRPVRPPGDRGPLTRKLPAPLAVGGWPAASLASAGRGRLR